MAETITEYKKPLVCPYCNKIAFSGNCIDEPGAQPTNGDGSVCTGCGECSIFENPNKLRKATVAEKEEIIERIKRQNSNH